MQALCQQHLKQQQDNIDAANATDQEIVETNKKALEADQFEAQQAILAHATDEGLNEAQIKKLHEDPTYAQELRETKLIEKRQKRIEDAGFEYAKDSTEENNVQLKKAYEAFRELNQRIEATRQLKFNLEAAKARIKARGVK